MTKYQLTKPGGPWDYPTLGFSATDGAILDGTLSTPAISTPPDAYWAVYGGGSAETGITRYGTGTVTPTPEVTDGWVLAYSDADNTFVPTDPADLTGDTGWRNIKSVVTACPNDLYARRVGNTVTLLFDPNNEGNDWSVMEEGELPSGFAHITGRVVATIVGGGVFSNPVINGSTLSVFTALAGQGSVTYVTKDAFPDPLPGVAANP